MEHTLTQLTRSYALLQQLNALEASNNDGTPGSNVSMSCEIIFTIHQTLFKCLGICTVHTHTHTHMHATDTLEMLAAVVITMFASLSYSGGEHWSTMTLTVKIRTQGLLAETLLNIGCTKLAEFLTTEADPDLFLWWDYFMTISKFITIQVDDHPHHIFISSQTQSSHCCHKELDSYQPYPLGTLFIIVLEPWSDIHEHYLLYSNFITRCCVLIVPADHEWTQPNHHEHQSKLSTWRSNF